MSTPLSICDFSARYGQTPAPQFAAGEQTGWNTKQSFTDCLCMALEMRESVREVEEDPFEAMSEAFLNNLSKAEELRKQRAKESEEDALMAVIDALNAPEEDKESGRLEQTLTKSLMQAGKAIQEQSEEILPDGSKWVTYVDPMTRLSVQVLLSCLGDQFKFEQVDEVQENIREAQREVQEQKTEEEGLDVTEQRDLSNTGDLSDPKTLERR